MPVEPLYERFYLHTFPLQFLVIPVGRHVIFNGAYVSWSYIQDTEPIESGVKCLPAPDPGLAFPALGNLVPPLLPALFLMALLGPHQSMNRLAPCQPGWAPS